MNVVLITDDTTHAAATNTKAAMEAGGHTVTFATTASVDGTFDFSSYDVIALCRVSPGAAALTHVRTAMDGGKPALVGASAISAGSNETGISTDLDLTGTINLAETTIDSEDITDNSHEITDAFSLGEVTLFDAGNLSFSLNSSTAHVGDALAVSSSGNLSLSGKTTLIAIEAGTDDMAATTLSARAVVWLNLYAGQADYNANGDTLVDACIDWLGASPAVADREITASLTGKGGTVAASAEVHTDVAAALQGQGGTLSAEAQVLLEIAAALEGQGGTIAAEVFTEEVRLLSASLQGAGGTLAAEAEVIAAVEAALQGQGGTLSADLEKINEIAASLEGAPGTLAAELARTPRLARLVLILKDAIDLQLTLED